MKYLCTQSCLRHVIGIGDGVPDKSCGCGKQVSTAELHVRFVAVALHVRFAGCWEKFGDFGKESLESH